MNDTSVSGPTILFSGTKKMVRFTGSTALKEGQGLCYDWDTVTGGAVTVANGNRLNHVELPSTTNARWFAGVAAAAYAARTGGRFIEICEPGSVCNILSKASTTIGVGRLTCEAGGTYAGYFRYAGFEGEGSAVPLQTVNRSETAGKCFARLEVGPPSGLVEVISANDDALLDGGATACMVGGVTYFDTDISTGADATDTLADGTIPGLKKAFVCQKAQTNDIVITVSSGVEGIGNADPTNAMTSIELDADTEEVALEWNAFDVEGLWVVQHLYGAALT